MMRMMRTSRINQLIGDAYATMTHGGGEPEDWWLETCSVLVGIDRQNPG